MTAREVGRWLMLMHLSANSPILHWSGGRMRSTHPNGGVNGVGCRWRRCGSKHPADGTTAMGVLPKVRSLSSVVWP